MTSVINLEEPGGRELFSTALGGLGTLLHFVFRHAGVGETWERFETLLVARPGAPLTAGVYRYEPREHRLAEVIGGAGVDAHGEVGSPENRAAPLSLVVTRRRDDEAAGAAAEALLRRLTLAAAELDLSPRPGTFGAPLAAGAEAASRIPAGVLDLGAPPGDPDELGRRLLSGGAGADPRRHEARRLEAILEVAAGRCHPPLFAAGAWRAVLGLARSARLPSRDVGLECRLGDEPRVDLAAALETRLQGVPASRDLLPAGADSGGDADARADAGWSALDRFRRAFEASAGLRWNTRHLGVELDAEASGAGTPGSPPPPAPGLFVGLADGTLGPATRREVRRAIDAGLPALMGEGAGLGRLAPVAAFLDALADGSTVHYFGAFAGRAPGVARFNVQYPDRTAAREHLRRQGYPERYLAALDEALHWPARVVLACDVGGPAPRRLGIELLPAHASALATVLDELVARGVSTPGKRDAVLAWPGALQETEAPTPWPPPLAAAARRSPGVRSVLVFKVSHLKLVVDDRAWSAKAYLQIQHAWVPRSLGRP